MGRLTQGGLSRVRGAALVIALMLTTAVAMLAIHSLSSAALGLRMAANLEYRDRAAEAADYGILRALGAPGLSTASTLAQPVTVPVGDESSPSIPGSPADTYGYRLYFAGSSIPGPGLLAHHFVVECTGRSLRGATVTLVQGFRVVAGADTSSLDGLPRVRTYWMQVDAD